VLLLLLLDMTPNSKPPHTTSQDWPRGGLHSGAAQPTDDLQAQVEVEKYDGACISARTYELK
jgi:hypothetical protein